MLELRSCDLHLRGVQTRTDRLGTHFGIIPQQICSVREGYFVPHNWGTNGGKGLQARGARVAWLRRWFRALLESEQNPAITKRLDCTDEL